VVLSYRSGHSTTRLFRTGAYDWSTFATMVALESEPERLYILFAYIGFDAVSPLRRKLRPAARIILPNRALSIAVDLYDPVPSAVGGVLTGMESLARHQHRSAIARALPGPRAPTASHVHHARALEGLTSVIAGFSLLVSLGRRAFCTPWQ